MLVKNKDRVQRKDIEEINSSDDEILEEADYEDNKEIVPNITEFEGDLLKTGGIPLYGLDLSGGKLRWVHPIQRNWIDRSNEWITGAWSPLQLTRLHSNQLNHLCR